VHLTLRAERLAWVSLIALALVLRLIGLADRPFHHDESQDAYFSWVFLTEGDYEYRPILHGPLRFYLTAAIFGAFGDSDFTARLAPALMGTALVACCWLLRGLLGRVAAFAAAVLFAVGPSYLYYSRFAREDIYIACITIALLAVVFRFLDRPRPHQPAVIGALLALSFATKESTFITVFVAGTFFLALLAHQARRHGLAGAPLVVAVRSVGGEPWAWAFAAFAGVFAVLFTTFLTHPGGLWDGVYEGLHYWLGQHEVGRGGEPWFFYLVVLFGEEWPALALGAVGAAVALRHPTPLRLFLIWAFALSLVVYSWAGEKFAWLVLHPLLPLLLLAGLGVQAIWERRRTWAGRLALPAVAVALAYVVVASWWANAEHGADPRELLVSTQSAPEVKRVAAGVVRRARGAPRPPAIVVDSAEGATFPWAWYLRDLRVGYADLRRGALPDADVVILTEGSRAVQRDALRAYRGRRFAFRVWWVRDYGRQSPRAWARWLARREPWNPTGGMPEWIYVRPEATSQTTVPPRWSTRRPSRSHLGTPASPWSARSSGPTTT
jgi:uncharacterized protein (TIGR03663 family)